MTNNNADDYAAANQNRWFTANGQTSADGDLTGQCVTLDKWFFQDMCDGFPNPFAARGNGKDVGATLVAQGLATEVAYANRQRGDLISYIYGTYGHTAIQLSGGRVFESNVNWSGVSSRVVDGETVYASRIGNENEAWRSTKNPHIYRLKNYSEGGTPTVTNPSITTLRIVESEVVGSDRDFVHSGQFDAQLEAAHGWKEVNAYVYEMWTTANAVAYRALKDQWKAFYNQYQPQIDELTSRPTKAQYDGLTTQLTTQAATIKQLQADLALQTDDTKNLNAFGVALRWFITRVGLSK